MTARRGGICAVLLAGAIIVAAASTATALPAPPSPDTFSTTTNAMLRPADVSAPVSMQSMWTVLYQIPSGGQDPYALCSDAEGRRVILPTAGAIGYRSETAIANELYVYSSVAAADRAWRFTDRQVAKVCKGSYTEGHGSVTITRGRVSSPVGGPAGWWIHMKGTKGAPIDQYLTALQVGNAVQLVYAASPGAPLSNSRIQSVKTMTPILAARYANAAHEPMTQPELLTVAQHQMLQSSDVPASLPYTTPGRNGWSLEVSDTPGDGPWSCQDSGTPGVASFAVELGGRGDTFDFTGIVTQSTTVYADAATAERAWRHTSAMVNKCRTSHPPISTTESINTMRTGVSALSFNGTSGLWWRSLDTYPNTGKQCVTTHGKSVECGSYSSGSYSIYLLVGRSIQHVMYTRSIERLGYVAIDQVAVNGLAQTLATRWLAAVG